jgi:hypothetical protein
MEWANWATSSAIPLTKLVLPSFRNHMATVVCASPSTSTTHQPHMGRNPHKVHLNQIPHKVKAQLLAFLYERMSSPWNSSGQHSLGLIKFKLSVRIKIFSEGCITSLMCRKAINKALKSAEEMPSARLVNLNPNPPSSVRWIANPALPSIN